VNAACALLLLLVMTEAVAEASRTRPEGSHWRAWSSFRFTLSKPLYKLIYHFEVSSERPPRINKKFRFLAK